MPDIRKILIIQTASIGDVILATPLVETLAENFPDAAIHFLLKKGNEGLFQDHPKLKRVMTWDKSRGKLKNLAWLVRQVRKEHYDLVVDVHRFFSSGLLTVLSGARIKSGFDKNPLSAFFTKKAKHIIGKEDIHETERNLALLTGLAGKTIAKARLYPSSGDLEAVKAYKILPYICIAPASLWYTKQYPEERWIEFIHGIPQKFQVYLLGAASDQELCERILKQSAGKSVYNLAGKLSFLQTAALMKDAGMNFVNDSAPLHLASAVNARVTAVFCSTVPGFGFGPLSEDAAVVETRIPLSCRPCGLHGYRECPEKHFKCALTINKEELFNRIPGV